MALSNMRVEPRREIMESVIGIGAMGVIGGGVWGLALLINSLRPTPNMGASIGCALMTVGLVIPLLIGVVLFTHFVGEEISEWLAKIGMDPRPKDRYKMLYSSIEGKCVRTKIKLEN